MLLKRPALRSSPTHERAVPASHGWECVRLERSMPVPRCRFRDDALENATAASRRSAPVARREEPSNRLQARSARAEESRVDAGAHARRVAQSSSTFRCDR